MDDEKFDYFEDLREKQAIKKSAAARNVSRRGAVRLPIDSLTRKEIAAMSGETKTYRMNDPMKYFEFQVMPDDLKKTYILSLRQKFNVPDLYIAKMMGCARGTLFKALKSLDLAAGKSSNHSSWDKDGFFKWCGWAAESEAEATPEPAVPPVNDEPEKPSLDINRQGGIAVGSIKAEPLIPYSGVMTFSAPANEALARAAQILGAADASITVSWVLSEGAATNG